MSPRPETTRAILPNSRGRATPHVYSHTEDIEIEAWDGLRRAHGFFFQCQVTGAVRLWGYGDYSDEKETDDPNGVSSVRRSSGQPN